MKTNLWNKPYGEWTMKDGLVIVGVTYGTAAVLQCIYYGAKYIKKKSEEKKLMEKKEEEN